MVNPREIPGDWQGQWGRRQVIGFGYREVWWGLAGVGDENGSREPVKRPWWADLEAGDTDISPRG